MLRFGALAVVVIGLLGCKPGEASGIGHPRIEVEVTGIGDEGGQRKFRVDAEGRFETESRGDIGNGTIEWERCRGQLEVDQVASVFASVDSAKLGANSQTPSEGRGNSRRRTTIMVARDPGDAAYPIDRAEFDRLDPLLDKLRKQAGQVKGDCEEGRER